MEEFRYPTIDMVTHLHCAETAIINLLMLIAIKTHPKLQTVYSAWKSITSTNNLINYDLQIPISSLQNEATMIYPQFCIPT